MLQGKRDDSRPRDQQPGSSKKSASGTTTPGRINRTSTKSGEVVGPPPPPSPPRASFGGASNSTTVNVNIAGNIHGMHTPTRVQPPPGFRVLVPRSRSNPYHGQTVFVEQQTGKIFNVHMQQIAYFDRSQGNKWTSI